MTPWIAKVVEEKMRTVPGCCPSHAHIRQLNGNVTVCLACHSGIGADIAWLEEDLNVDTRGVQGTINSLLFVRMDYGSLTGDATRCLSRRTDE